VLPTFVGAGLVGLRPKGNGQVEIEVAAFDSTDGFTDA
jgi:hypothetical protein